MWNYAVYRTERYENIFYRIHLISGVQLGKIPQLHCIIILSSEIMRQ
uniref:Uncharacterized protein n=1 Tax=Rhizophora mucronata TaxID=61149 RepID=A0A2P2JP80_RHIMU